MSDKITSYLNCASCDKRIRHTWIQVIVRELQEDDPIHTVGFLCGEDCLLDYAAMVGGLMMKEAE
ncbi:hypothetical protein LCGC14_1248910 [marine sediment metagenome]|uniref:Uncharacterized protein n=1 Tax=marine sediment metagenome TaxID=412755 RepID=A0A0F9L3L5_9ZZZZ